MVGTQPVAGSVKAVQAADPAAQGAALHPQKILFVQAGPGDFFGTRQNGIGHSPGVVTVTGGGKQGHAVDGLKTAAEGSIDQSLLVQALI